MVIVYLTKLKIARFRGIESVFLKDIKNGTNLIVGPNDAGKTTILEAIKILLTLGKGVVLSESDYYLQGISKGFEIKAKIMCEWAQHVGVQNESGETYQKDNGDRKLTSITKNEFEIDVAGTDKMQLAHSVNNPNQIPEHVLDMAMKSLAETNLVVSNQVIGRSQKNSSVDQSEPRNAELSPDQESVALAMTENKTSTPITQPESLGKLQQVFDKNGLISQIQKSSPETIMGRSLAEMNLTTEQANVQIPISSWGTGNYGFADQLTSIQGSTPILLIDKVEGDLDSKRLHIPFENILESPKQSFVTTINPTILSRPLTPKISNNLTIWHLDREVNIAKSEGRHTKIAHKSQPNAYFSTIPIIGEGATEVGILEVCLERTFKNKFETHGIGIVSGGGNQGAILLAREWKKANHKLFILVDNEGDPSMEGKFQELQDYMGKGVFQWPEGNSEKNIIQAIPDKFFENLVKHPTDNGKTLARLRTVLKYLNKPLPSAKKLTYKFVKLEAGDQFHQIVIDVASGKTPDWFKGKKNEQFKESGRHWYKSLAGGKELGKKIFSCGAWPHLKGDMMPFFNTLRVTVGLPEISDLYN